MVVLAAVHGAAAGLMPWLGSGLPAVASSALGLVSMAVLAFCAYWLWAGREIGEPLLVGLVLLACLVSGIRVAATSAPWGGSDVLLALVLASCLPIRRRMLAVALVGGVLSWIAGAGWGVVGAAGPGEAWLLSGGVVVAAAVASLLVHQLLEGLQVEAEQARQALSTVSTADPLTGVANRRGLELVALPMIEHARRQGEAVHCLFVDVDGFRAVNESAGRARGDEVLIAVAGALRASLRGTDVLARWAGDEFVVIGPGTGTSPLEMERRVRSKLNGVLAVPVAGWPGRVSIGTATLVPWDDGNLDSLLTRAEQDLRLRRSLRQQRRERPGSGGLSASRAVPERQEP